MRCGEERKAILIMGSLFLMTAPIKQKINAECRGHQPTRAENTCEDNQSESFHACLCVLSVSAVNAHSVPAVTTTVAGRRIISPSA